MITTSSKFFYGLSGVLWLTAVLYGYATTDVSVLDFSSMQAFVDGLTSLVDGNTGPLTFGWEGGVGEVGGYTLLMSGAVLSLFVGIATTAFRDADPDVAADMLGTDTVPAPTVPGASYWPIVGAFGAGVTVVGLALNNVFFVAGLILLGAVAVEWTMQAWAERATGDPTVNHELRNRIMLPFEVPIAGAAVVAVVIAGYSRVFLALSAENAVWAALAVAALIFGVGTLLSTQAQLRKDVLAGLLAIAAVATIGVGIFAAVEGEREFHHHEPAGEHQGDDDDAEHGESTDEEEGAAALEESK